MKNKVLISDIEKYLDGNYDWENNPDNVDFDFTLPEIKEYHFNYEFEGYLIGDELIDDPEYYREYGGEPAFSITNKIELYGPIVNNTILYITLTDEQESTISENIFENVENNNFEIDIYSMNDDLIYKKVFLDDEFVDFNECEYYVGKKCFNYETNYYINDFKNEKLIYDNDNKKVKCKIFTTDN